MHAVHVRAAGNGDLEFIEELLPRLTESGVPRWRDARAVAVTAGDQLRNALTDPDATAAIFIAEAGGRPQGFIHAEPEQDFFSGEQRGYIANLVVSQAAEGLGVGRALMTAVEGWAKENRCRYLTLNVFATNSAARRFYERMGYEEDSLRLVKELHEAE